MLYRRHGGGHIYFIEPKSTVEGGGDVDPGEPIVDCWLEAIPNYGRQQIDASLQVKLECINEAQLLQPPEDDCLCCDL